MKDKTQKSHLADYIDSMMKTKSDEFHSPTTLECPTPKKNQKIAIALVKPSNSASSIDPPKDDTSGEAIDHGIGEPLGERNGKAIDMSTGSSIVQSVKESMTQSIGEPIAAAIGESTYKTSEDHDNQCGEILLNSTQYLLFYSIKEINGRLTNLSKIGLQLSISQNTLKSALRKIIEKKVILYHGRSNCLGLHGFRAQAIECPICLIGTEIAHINQKLKFVDFEAMCIEAKRSNIADNHRLTHRLTQPLAQHPEGSSSNINKNELLQKIEDCFQYHPDFEFWTKENLSPELVVKWINDYKIHPNEMILYLSQCAFDFVQNKKETRNNTSPINFFHGGLKKFNSYLKPKGYQTIEERRLSELKRAVEEKERILRETEEFERRNEKAELELNFRKMMSDKTSDLYRRCYSSTKPMFRENEESPGFLAAMKISYEQIMAENQATAMELKNGENDKNPK